MAENCEETRRELSGQTFDLLIATTNASYWRDLFEMIPSIKASSHNIKTILISSWDEPTTSVLKEKFKPDTVMTMPFTLEDLLAKVSSLLVGFPKRFPDNTHK